MESICIPAQIRVLIVPATDHWTKDKFLKRVGKLRSTPHVKLVDITPVDDAHFNPQGFPQGSLLFDIQTDIQDESSMMFLYDFEPYRKTFVAVGLCEVSQDKKDSKLLLEVLKNKYSNSICHCLIYEDIKYEEKGLDNVFSFKQSSKTIMCDIGRCFLQSVSHYYRSYKHVTLRSPGAIGAVGICKTMFSDKVPNTSSKKITSKIEKIGVSLKKKSLKSGLIVSSSMSDKSQQKLKGRKLKILANFQLLSGQYTDALVNFSEASSIAHRIHDHLWLGSSLEGVALTMILLSNLSISFQIPSIILSLCPMKTYTINNGSNSGRSSVSSCSNNGSNMQSTFQSPRNSGGSFNLQLNSNDIVLAFLLRGIYEKVIHYFDSSLSHSVEYTPQLVYCQTLLRVLKFMTQCNKNVSQVDTFFRKIVLDVQQKSNYKKPGGGLVFSKFEIYQLSSKVFDLQFKNFDIPTQINIYMELASINKDLEFTRKRGFLLRTIFVKLLSLPDRSIWAENFDQLVDDLIDIYGISSWKPEENVKDSMRMKWAVLQKSLLILLIDAFENSDQRHKLMKFLNWAITRYSHMLTKMEQSKIIRLIIKISKLNSELYIQYWDPFLVRSVSLLRLDNSVEYPTKFPAETENRSVINAEQVFNPFKILGSKNSNKPALENNVFFVSEDAQIDCTFQNPFKVDLEITSIALCDEDCKVLRLLSKDVSIEEPFVVKPGNMRTYHGKVVFIDRTFPICEITHLMLGVFQLPQKRFQICASEQTSVLVTSRIIPGSCSVLVIQEQPHLQFISSDLPNNSCMLLIGMKKSFRFKLHNISLSKSVNYLEFSTITNVEKELNDDYWKNLLPDELYNIELQLQYLKKEFITIKKIPNELKPNELAELEVHLNGTQVPINLNQVELIVKYGSKEEDGSIAYFKTSSITFNISLRSLIEVTRVHVLSLHSQIPDKLNVDWADYLRTKMSQTDMHPSDFSLMLLDIRNSWASQVSLTLSYADFKKNIFLLEAHNTRKVVVPVNNLNYDPQLQAKDIPIIFGNRQFVHSGLPENEIKDLCHRFWCREHILSNLNCDWKLNSDSGIVNFRTFIPKLENPAITTLTREAMSPYNLYFDVFKTKISVGSEVELIANIKSKDYSTHSNIVFLQFQFFERCTRRPIPNMNEVLIYNGILTNLVHLGNENKAILKLTAIAKGEFEIHAHILDTNITAFTIVHVT